jgi:hypothetical protein
MTASKIINVFPVDFFFDRWLGAFCGGEVLLNKSVLLIYSFTSSPTKVPKFFSEANACSKITTAAA